MKYITMCARSIVDRYHTELAYILEMPKEPGEAQRELGIEKDDALMPTGNDGIGTIAILSSNK